MHFALHFPCKWVPLCGRCSTQTPVEASPNPPAWYCYRHTRQHTLSLTGLTGREWANSCSVHSIARLSLESLPTISSFHRPCQFLLACFASFPFPTPPPHPPLSLILRWQGTASSEAKPSFHLLTWLPRSFPLRPSSRTPVQPECPQFPRSLKGCPAPITHHFFSFYLLLASIVQPHRRRRLLAHNHRAAATTTTTASTSTTTGHLATPIHPSIHSSITPCSCSVQFNP